MAATCDDQWRCSIMETEWWLWIGASCNHNGCFDIFGLVLFQLVISIHGAWRRCLTWRDLGGIVSFPKLENLINNNHQWFSGKQNFCIKTKRFFQSWNLGPSYTKIKQSLDLCCCSIEYAAIAVWFSPRVFLIKIF